nr:LarC family nickel insertion protein [Lachnospiraceae bacterium]
IYSGHIKSELCTPTGAALLKHFATSFGEMPVMTVEKIGYGMGKKDFEQANCVRAFFGNTSDNTGEVTELSFNVDDMTAERIAFACEMFYEAGAREVFSVACGMKKSRPGTLISVICDEEKKEIIVEAIFKHTTTLGLRETKYKRYTLERNILKKDTRFGSVRIKQSEGYGVKREKYEYEDLARIARDNKMSIEEVIDRLKSEQ